MGSLEAAIHADFGVREKKFPVNFPVIWKLEMRGGDQNRLQSLTLLSQETNSQNASAPTKPKCVLWCAQPMLFAALSFASGVTLVRLTIEQAWRPPNWLLLASIALVVIACYWLRTRTIASFL